jgi:hypothetical protein
MKEYYGTRCTYIHIDDMCTRGHINALLAMRRLRIIRFVAMDEFHTRITPPPSPQLTCMMQSHVFTLIVSNRLTLQV